MRTWLKAIGIAVVVLAVAFVVFLVIVVWQGVEAGA